MSDRMVLRFRRDFDGFEGREMAFTFSFSTELLRELGEAVIGTFVSPRESALDLMFGGVELRREAAFRGHLTSAECAAAEQVCREIVAAVQERVHRCISEVRA